MITDSEAPPPTAEQAQETEAAASTASIQECLDRARMAIDEADQINAIGDFVDPASTLAKIIEAKRALSNAETLVLLRPRPAERTYEAIEQ